VPREYRVPGKLVKAGDNVVAIRVSDLAGHGGPWGQPADTMFAELADGSEQTKVSLAGEWRIWPEFLVPPRPGDPRSPNRPSVLYNAMIQPLVPFALRGALWYQGESNAGRAMQYRKLLPALIGDWRRAWQTEDFPFLIVQLANFMATADQPQESAWAALREAQFLTLSVPQTGLAVAIDIGDAKDIHPRNKQDVGGRLALWALAKTYGQDIACSGPLYQSMKVEGDKIRLQFAHVGKGLVAKGGALKYFAIAGEDKKFVWANAVIDGGTVVVSSPDVPKPAAVRYAWANNPEGCNLYNEAGLPASSFRTDDWPVP
jgi:sialate O-acetylesterase